MSNESLFHVLLSSVPYLFLGLVFLGTVIRYGRLQRRQSHFDEAERALADAGFVFERKTEGSRLEVSPSEPTLTSGLFATRGERTHLQISLSREGARAAVRVRGIELVSRATFQIVRESIASRWQRRLGLVDIEIGDPHFDGHFKVSGWPFDDVRAVIRSPAVRAALEALFARPSVEAVDLLASSDTGFLRVEWSMASPDWPSLAHLADEALALAIALDDARWLEPVGKPVAVAAPAGGLGPAGGAPVVVPGRR